MIFNRQLQPGLLDHLNWTARHANEMYTGTHAVATNGVVTVQMGGAVENAGPEICNFDPPPFDVLSLRDAAAVAFTDFPLT